jgi:hypothetical protein
MRSNTTGGGGEERGGGAGTGVIVQTSSFAWRPHQHIDSAPLDASSPPTTLLELNNIVVVGWWAKAVN